ncbi:hypothetical protein ACRXCV_05025 [Halobacteriovorax sp. GFR7]|uniref:hypothetical protein n=1 Tax=unclassified Halobacteriovorax TaxID=2639665 RepID=UPI003D9597D9
MTSFTLLIASSGFIAHKIIHFLRRTDYRKTNGWDLVLYCLLYGILPTISTLFFYFDEVTSKPLDLERVDYISIISIIFILSIFEAAAIANLLSSEAFAYFKKEASSLFGENVSNGLVYDTLGKLSDLQLEDDDRVIMVTMNNGKVYVGRLYDVDLDQNLDFQEMYLSISLIKSGYRRNENLSVKYDSNYEEFLSSKIAEFESSTKDMPEEEVESLKEVFVKEISKPKYLPISKIESLCIYSKVLNEITSMKNYQYGLFEDL